MRSLPRPIQFGIVLIVIAGLVGDTGRFFGLGWSSPVVWGSALTAALGFATVIITMVQMGRSLPR